MLVGRAECRRFATVLLFRDRNPLLSWSHLPTRCSLAEGRGSRQNEAESTSDQTDFGKFKNASWSITEPCEASCRGPGASRIGQGCGNSAQAAVGQDLKAILSGGRAPDPKVVAPLSSRELRDDAAFVAARVPVSLHKTGAERAADSSANVVGLPTRVGTDPNLIEAGWCRGCETAAAAGLDHPDGR